MRDRFIRYIERVEQKKNKIASRIEQRKCTLPFFPDKKNDSEVEKLEIFLKHLKDYESNCMALRTTDVANKEFYKNHYCAVLVLLEKTENPDASLNGEDFKLIVTRVQYKRTIQEILLDLIIIFSGIALFVIGTGAVVGLSLGIILGSATPIGFLAFCFNCFVIGSLLGAAIGSLFGILVGIVLVPFLKDEPLCTINKYLTNEVFDTELLKTACYILHKDANSGLDAEIELDPLF